MEKEESSSSNSDHASDENKNKSVEKAAATVKNVKTAAARKTRRKNAEAPLTDAD